MISSGQKQTGFTIVELLIVIVVIAILAAITIVAFNGIQDRAKFSQKRSDLSNIQKVVEMYYAENNAYPNTSNNWRFQRELGDAFIPGVVPKYTASLPSVNDGFTNQANSNTYAYRSNGTDYKIIRFIRTQDGGIPAGEWAQVPASMKDGSAANQDRYGVWSSGGSGF
jgi:prepilin-type N-terminal cleavage/methylation domain-containing protein